jgi:hypothetical protein
MLANSLEAVKNSKLERIRWFIAIDLFNVLKFVRLRDCCAKG